MRSRREIAFRLRQELANFAMRVSPPRLPRDSQNEPKSPRGLPPPDAVIRRVQGTPFAREVERLADCILVRQFPILGIIVQNEADPCWRRDPVHRVESPPLYFRRIPYLDPARAGDHKIVWELNRHQHLVLLAQAWLLTGNHSYLDDITLQLESWYLQNPPLCGINWTSALEVAFRSLSWIWVDQLAGPDLPPAAHRRMLEELYRHGCYLRHNLSFYFSPNTHLLGEAVSLHALGTAYPQWPHSEDWRSEGARIVENEIRRQVRDDGSHFEQSSYYHVYALDFFLLHLIFAGSVTPECRNRLHRMSDYLNVLLGPARAIPFLGDDDGGRLFHPYGDRARFGRATLATAALVLNRRDLPYTSEDLHEQAAWWLSDTALDAPPPIPPAPPPSRLFPDAGLIVMNHGSCQLIFDAGPFGEASAGHSHSDTLSLVLRDGDRDILIDPGTYTYVADPEWRNAFRGSSAHNTIRIDGFDQAVPAGPFRWNGKPDVRLIEFEDRRAAAECRYRGFIHRRSVDFTDPTRVVIHDEIEGPPGDHLIEQFWHAGEPVEPISPNVFRIGTALLTLPEPALLEEGWRSPAFFAKHHAPVIRLVRRGTLPSKIDAVVELKQ